MGSLYQRDILFQPDCTCSGSPAVVTHTCANKGNNDAEEDNGRCGPVCSDLELIEDCPSLQFQSVGFEVRPGSIFHEGASHYQCYFISAWSTKPGPDPVITVICGGQSDNAAAFPPATQCLRPARTSASATWAPASSDGDREFRLAAQQTPDIAPAFGESSAASSCSSLQPGNATFLSGTRREDGGIL